ncbi:S-adenosyl-L-methionine-dependent methyltransferase [Aspergillus avenaceus]|uniref:S-adenosyl-L-methionine-dependent methyltransferase n=1 Tax=Aspergillus avenaceus TaxID=36643 RepID=A0A5N6TKN2_ASPAV|nr:S-adenosyl-L-methionine-dependent methyltransferase [Aspergillus avenaceus]
MERQPRTPADAEKLLALSDLLHRAALTVKEEWAKEDFSGPLTADTPRLLPSSRLWEAQKTIEGIAGTLTELICEPNQRIQQIAPSYFESRALFIVTERRIPDLLAKAGSDGLDINTLADQTGIESRKLSRVMRNLCSIHVFNEVAENRFMNNRISAALAHNEGLCAYVQLYALSIYHASEYLARCLLGPTGASFDVRKTALQESLGIEVPLWEWMAEKIPIDSLCGDGPGYPGIPDANNWAVTGDENGLVNRPELGLFALGMTGGGNAQLVLHMSLVADFPWGELDDGVVVDVGGGVGGFVLQLLPVYPSLRFVIQDRAENVKIGETEVFPRQAPGAISSGRVRFQIHDFFDVNPIKGAAVYWLRGILHDWSDEYCVEILKAIKPSMGPKSKILLCDMVMNTTFGSPEISSAPFPLPANYGYHTRYCHGRDLAVMSIINGVERTPAELKDIVEKAGLQLKKVWEVRSVVGITEIGL